MRARIFDCGGGCYSSKDSIGKSRLDGRKPKSNGKAFRPLGVSGG